MTSGRVPLLGAGLLLAVSTQVAAQDDLGIRLGSFLLQPQLGVTESYSDNVFLEEDDKEGDFVTIVGGQLQAQQPRKAEDQPQQNSLNGSLRDRSWRQCMMMH